MRNLTINRPRSFRFGELIRTGIRLLLTCSVLFAGVASAEDEQRPLLAVVGDSLAAGFQNFSLSEPQQQTSFANLISLQAQAEPLSLPLMAEPGFPTPMFLKREPRTPLEAFVACAKALPFGSTDLCEAPKLSQPVRLNPGARVTNLAVPGMTVEQALSKLPIPPASDDAVDVMTFFVLGFPPAGSQVDQAVALNPINALVWIGANDVLMAGLSGDFRLLTRIDRFYAAYRTLMERLASTDANLVVGNIPDVTAIPYFMPAATLAAQSGRSIGQVTGKLGIDRRDFLRPAAVAIAMDILEGKRSGRLPDTCPATVPGLPFPTTPCVLKSSEAAVLHAAVFAFNLVILERAIAHRATLVDIYSLVKRLKANGYALNGKKLTTDYLGGFFSLDALHPNNTGQAIIANEWIKTMNARLGMNIPMVAVN